MELENKYRGSGQSEFSEADIKNDIKEGYPLNKEEKAKEHRKIDWNAICSEIDKTENTLTDEEKITRLFENILRDCKDPKVKRELQKTYQQSVSISTIL